ncbi:NAD-dependent epimerase/dehydratase [Rhodobacterales bacterium HTCC2150]|nr:NAD-dependent epimerase/dehydratase [Rhodobacterales bacterium HTCC2150] [Rhodobacteraceae bacterium HTCC2150]
MKNKLFTFGHGYSAHALAQILPSDWAKVGTTRSQERAVVLVTRGITPEIWPNKMSKIDLQDTTHLLLSIAPNENGDPVYNELADEIAAMPNLKWLGYLSTTGVYGDHQGGWVDENTPLTPATKRGRMRVLAEGQWQELASKHDLPLHIFRIAGIYGPGRGPFAKVRSGTARRIIKENQVFSRIHVKDIAQILAASIDKPNPGGIYNLCDDLAAPPQDVIAFAAQLLNLPIPEDTPFETAELTDMARSFYSESKRVRNDKIKNELGVRLIHPDYRAGLLSMIKAAGSA